MPSWTPANLAAHVATARRLALVPLFVAAAARHGVPLAVLVAVADRETHLGALVENAGWRGDGGHGRGVMQIDDRAHPMFVNAHADDDHAANIQYGAAYLATLARTFGGYTKAALAAYNAGPGAVQRAVSAGRDPDSVTTGGDYGADVLARADVLRSMVASWSMAGGALAVIVVAAVAAAVAFRTFAR